MVAGLKISIVLLMPPDRFKPDMTTVLPSGSVGTGGIPATVGHLRACGELIVCRIVRVSRTLHHRTDRYLAVPPGDQDATIRWRTTSRCRTDPTQCSGR